MRPCRGNGRGENAQLGTAHSGESAEFLQRHIVRDPIDIQVDGHCRSYVAGENSGYNGDRRQFLSIYPGNNPKQ
jgi:hypothetical protein